MRVLLIHTFISSQSAPAFMVEPLGLISLATYLEQKSGGEYNIRILDLYALGYENVVRKGDIFIRGLSQDDEIIKHVNLFLPEIVGISINFTSYSLDAYNVAKLIKRTFPFVKIVLGGAHATMEADSILREHDYVDYIVRGEGEVTFYELVSTIKNNGNISAIKGLSYKQNGVVIKNPERELIENLDDLPIPNREYVDMIKYFKTLEDVKGGFSKNIAVASMMTSRGCPFNCIFCSTKNMWKRRWRAHSAERVAQEIEELVFKYGIKEISINDDQFILDKKRVMKICDLVIKKKLKVIFVLPSGTSIWLMDYELMEKMKKAGFYRLCFPIESGNKNTLKFIRKPIDLDKTKKMIEVANKIGFWTTGFFIIGFPYETKEEIMETIKYAYNSKLDAINMYIASPYPGAEMYEIYRQEGLLDEDKECMSFFRSDLDTKTMKAEELQAIRVEAQKGYLMHRVKFLVNPINFYIYFLPKIQNLTDLKYAIKQFFRVRSINKNLS